MSVAGSMPAGYQPLSSENDQDRELNAAFDEEDEEETTPLTRPAVHSSQHDRSSSSSGYDFERTELSWDQRPPLGEPWHGTGILPTGPVQIPQPSRPNIFRRALGAIFPAQYSRLPTSDSGSATTVGHGNDGVFANIMGKPTVAQVRTTEDGQIHIVPETVQKEVPPTYSEAQQDAAPPYWETTVHAPSAMLGTDVLYEDLPVGSAVTFIVTMGISFFFQLVGFLLTYLLHTSHAGRYGALGGLGLTLIQYGFYTKVEESSENLEPTGSYDRPWWSVHQGATTATTSAIPSDPSPSRRDNEAVIPSDDGYVVTGFSTKDWLSFFIMTIGWFFLLSSIIGFLRVKRWERRIRDAADPQPSSFSAEDMQADQEIRRNLESVFGLSPSPNSSSQVPDVRDDGNGNALVLPNAQFLEEVRLTRDLRAAGLL